MKRIEPSFSRSSRIAQECSNLLWKIVINYLCSLCVEGGTKQYTEPHFYFEENKITYINCIPINYNITSKTKTTSSHYKILVGHVNELNSNQFCFLNVPNAFTKRKAS